MILNIITPAVCTSTYMLHEVSPTSLLLLYESYTHLARVMQDLYSSTLWPNVIYAVINYSKQYCTYSNYDSDQNASGRFGLDKHRTAGLLGAETPLFLLPLVSRWIDK